MFGRIESEANMVESECNEVRLPVSPFYIVEHWTDTLFNVTKDRNFFKDNTR